MSHCITAYKTLDIVDNISDHMPVLLEISGHAPLTTRSASVSDNELYSKPLWSNASVVDISKYKHCLDLYLDCIDVPVEAMLCRDYNCCNKDHHDSLKSFTTALIESCIKARKDSIPFSSTGKPTKQPDMPGWNLELSISREQSLFWHDLWKTCNEPTTGPVVTVMRYVRNHYHYLIRRIKSDKNSATKR